MQAHFSGSSSSGGVKRCQFQGSRIQPGTDVSQGTTVTAETGAAKTLDREKLLGVPALILSHMPLVHSGEDYKVIVDELQVALMPFLQEQTKAAQKQDPALGRCLGELSHSLANEFQVLDALGNLMSRSPEIRQRTLQRLGLNDEAAFKGYVIERMSDMVAHSRNWLGLLENRQPIASLAETAFELLGKDIATKKLAFTKPDPVILDGFKVPGVTNLDFFSMLFHPLHNASKYTMEGAVTVDLEVDSHADGTAFLYYTVKDTGIGMPDALRKLVNDPAAVYPKGLRGENVGETSGTGFGMPELKALVLQAGGSIKAEPNPDGQGTVMTLKLPLVSTSPDAGDRLSVMA